MMNLKRSWRPRVFWVDNEVKNAPDPIYQGLIDLETRNVKKILLKDEKPSQEQSNKCAYIDPRFTIEIRNATSGEENKFDEEIFSAFEYIQSGVYGNYDGWQLSSVCADRRYTDECESISKYIQCVVVMKSKDDNNWDAVSKKMRDVNNGHKDQPRSADKESDAVYIRNGESISNIEAKDEKVFLSWWHKTNRKHKTNDSKENKRNSTNSKSNVSNISNFSNINISNTSNSSNSSSRLNTLNRSNKSNKSTNLLELNVTVDESKTVDLQMTGQRAHQQQRSHQLQSHFDKSRMITTHHKSVPSLLQMTSNRTGHTQSERQSSTPKSRHRQNDNLRSLINFIDFNNIANLRNLDHSRTRSKSISMSHLQQRSNQRSSNIQTRKSKVGSSSSPARRTSKYGTNSHVSHKHNNDNKSARQQKTAPDTVMTGQGRDEDKDSKKDDEKEEDQYIDLVERMKQTLFVHLKHNVSVVECFCVKLNMVVIVKRNMIWLLVRFRENIFISMITLDILQWAK